MKLKEAITLSNQIISRIHGADKIYVVGSIRRQAAEVGDIDLLVVADDIKKIKLDFKEKPTRSGPAMTSYTIAGIGVDVFTTNAAELPFALYHYTGPKEYNIRVRAFVKKKGYLLNQHGIFKDGKRAYGSSAIKTERDLVDYIGVSWYEPSERK